MREAFDDRQAEALHKRRVNGEGAGRISGIDGGVAEGAGVVEGATGGLQGADLGEGGGARLRMGEADEVKGKRGPLVPELFGGVEERAVIFPPFNGTNRKDLRTGVGKGGGG
ncbi:MAG: hypothetical protein RL077_5073 [Verrucomicrobiota bacterium]